MNYKSLLLIFLLVLNLCTLNAQSSYAKIVVYRNENNSAKVEEEYKIFADDNLTTNLKNYSTDEFYMPEGSFTLRVNDIFPTTTKVQCTKGSTHYFKIFRDQNLQGKPIVITAVDSITAKNDMKLVIKTPSKKISVFNLERLNGIGLVIEPGLGFNKTEVVSTTQGTAAMLSFGGGAAFGLSFSHRFSNYFGCSVELSDQFSSLSPSLNNATVNFNKGILSTTPYFIIQLEKQDKHEIKIGGGLDYHFSPTLTLETDKLTNGFNDEWSYDNTWGYHLIAFYNMLLGERIWGHIGLKYSNVKYSFASSKKYQPFDQNLRTPNGNSLSVSLGFEYCF